MDGDEAVSTDLGDLPVVQVDDATAEHLELALDGWYAPGPRYLDAAQRQAVEAEGTLPDGTPWELPLHLVVPRHEAMLGDRLVLSDPEAVPLAVLDVEEALPTDAGTALAGPLHRLRRRSARTFASLEANGVTASGRRPDRPQVVVPTERPLHRHDLDAVEGLAGPGGAGVVLLGLVGQGRRTPRDPLARALLAAAEDLGTRSRRWVEVLLLPLPAAPRLDRAADRSLTVRVAAALGPQVVLLPDDGSGDARGVPSAPEGVRVERGPASPWGDAVLEAALDAGSDLPSGFTPAGVERELRRLHPPTDRRGLVLLFTGLSGSGKSTVAAGVVAALQEGGERTVTVLDGDRVRTMLSSGLTFSREDRDLNVRRIGFVAAEVARHGGTAVCAPIAPYARTRAEVREMVEAAGGTLVLVHVSTPLEVCEGRDRKGLYAKARAGLIPAFTGVSDPYEEPQDADLTIDTSILSVDKAVDSVMSLLTERGFLRG